MKSVWVIIIDSDDVFLTDFSVHERFQDRISLLSPLQLLLVEGFKRNILTLRFVGIRRRKYDGLTGFWLDKLRH